MLALQAYKDKNGVILRNNESKLFIIDKHYKKCPDYRNKYFTLNCFTYRLEWIK